MSAVLEAEVKAYMVWIKLAFAVALLLAGVGTGCHLQKQRDQHQHDTDVALLGGAQSALTAVNDETKAKEAASAEEAKRANAAAQRSAAAAQALSRELAGIQSNIDTAKRNPKCKKALEAKTCALLL